MGLKVADNVICFTDDKGKGFANLVNLPNDLQVMAFNFTAYDSLLFHSKEINKEFLVLRLAEATGEDGIAKSSVLFGKTNQEWFYIAPPNTHLRHIDIILKKEWLEDYFRNEESGEILSNYITLNSPLLIYEMMDPEYLRLTNQILTLLPAKPSEQIIVYNRVCLILERFFAKLYRKIENINRALKLSSTELIKIKQVEVELLKDFSQQPPAISRLARIATMSPSKLKILFKEVFGQPINQYYQKQRMNRAKAMLLSKKYSLRKTSIALGFSSVSSFNKAFSKAFQQLPAEIIEPVNQKILD